MDRLRTLIFTSMLCLPPAALGAEAPQQRLIPLAFYTPDTSLGVGALLIKELDAPEAGEPSQLLALANVTLRKQSLVIIEPKIYSDDSLWEMSLKFAFQDFPSDYYGREEQSLDKAEAYEDVRWSIGGRVRRSLYGAFFGAMELEAVNLRQSAPDDAPAIQAEIERWGSRSFLWTRSLTLGYDSRVGRARPMAGSLATVYGRALAFRSDERRGEPLQLGFELRHYICWDNDLQSLAFQLAGSELEKDEVPFYILPGLGGNQVLRGYKGNRYRGYALAFAQSEYRAVWEGPWGYRVFAGVGAHARHMNDIPEQRAYTAAGVGVDYFLDARRRNNLRFDLGISEEGVGVYFLYGNAI